MLVVKRLKSNVLKNRARIYDLKVAASCIGIIYSSWCHLSEQIVNANARMFMVKVARFEFKNKFIETPFVTVTKIY